MLEGREGEKNGCLMDEGMEQEGGKSVRGREGGDGEGWKDVGREGEYG